MTKTEKPHTARLAALIILSATIPSLLLTSGCFAVVAGAGAGATVAYVRGDLDVTLDAGFEKSAHAVNKAIEQLAYAKVSENKDALQVTIIARTAADKKIEFYVEKLSEKSTKLKIRVGTFGDSALQTAILEKVKSHL